jgi:hypothetical protein
MIRIITNHIQCDECNAHLGYDKEDTYEAYNAFRTYRVLYLDCPKCHHSIPIRIVE